MPSYTQGGVQVVLPEDSEWDFVVKEATEKESLAGNEMIELELHLLKDGVETGPAIYDNLTFTEKSFWKIDLFREATGEKLVPGQQVVFNADDCIDRKGRVILTIDNYQGRSKNKVKAYVVPNGIIPSDKSKDIGTPGGIPF